MKKNMIALAVAGALVAPVAMAEVTVSGTLQAELVNVGGDATSPNGLYLQDGMMGGAQNTGNVGALNFSAAEDLGGGMKGLAKYSFNVLTDSQHIKTREAYVGLSTGFGAILAGRLNQPYKTSTVAYDPFLSSPFQARGNGGMNGALHGSEVDNAVAYANSFMGGMIKVVAAAVLDETKNTPSVAALPVDETVGNHAKALSVNVAPMTGLDIALAYFSQDKFGDLTGTTTVTEHAKETATKIGVKYSASAFSIAAQYEMLDKGFDADYTDGANLLADMDAKKHNVVFVTGTFNINEANGISASVGRTSKDAFKTDVDMYIDGAPVVVAGIQSPEDQSYMAVGFKHSFSKTTSAMVGYRKTANVNGQSGNDESAVGVGMRVSF